MKVRRIDPPGSAEWIGVEVRLRSPNGRSLLLLAEHGLGHGGGAMTIIDDRMVLMLFRDEGADTYVDIIAGSRWEVTS